MNQISRLQMMLAMNGSQSYHSIGPFYLGFTLELALLIEEGYERIQKEVWEKMNKKYCTPKVNWFLGGSTEYLSDDICEMIQTVKDDDFEHVWKVGYMEVFGGTPMVPQTFLVCEEELNTPIQEEFLTEKGHQFIIKRILLFFHGYGTGIFRIELESTINGPISHLEYRTLVQQVNKNLYKYINPLLRERTLELKEMLDDNIVLTKHPQQPLYTQLIKTKQTRLIERYEPFKCLWHHSVFIIQTDHTKDLRIKENVGELTALLDSSQEDGCKNCSFDPSIATYPAFGYSLFVYNKNASNANITLEILDRVIELAEYYYAATNLLDDILFLEFSIFKQQKEEL
jgi:hypothetical protein